MSSYFLECLFLVRLLFAKFRAKISPNTAVNCGSAATEHFYLGKVYVLLAACKGLVSRLHSEQGQPDK